MAITSITYNNFDTFTMTILTFLALYICLHFQKAFFSIQSWGGEFLGCLLPFK